MRLITSVALLSLVTTSAFAAPRTRVVSPPADRNAPRLQAVWLDRTAMRAGEHNTVFVQAEDDQSGVALVSGVFLSPAKRARIGFGCRVGINGIWECDIAPPACIDCGTWHLEQVQIMDKANNFTTARFDDPIVAAINLTISGDLCDSELPVLTAIVLDRTVVSNLEASTITVTTIIFDDGCGVASVSGQAVGPTGAGAQPRIYFSFSPSGEPNKWIARIYVPKFAARGVWNVYWMQILDKAHNLRTYAQNDPELFGATFRVE